MWGSDVGGVLALVPGFGLLVLLTARRTISVARLVALGSAAVAVVAAFALPTTPGRPSHQTHLGRFVGKVLHGGAGTILSRKWHSDVDLLTANAGTLFVPFAAAVALWLVLRPRPRLLRTYERHPELRYGLIVAGRRRRCSAWWSTTPASRSQRSPCSSRSRTPWSR